MDCAIAVEHMSFTYPNGFTALKDLNFTINKNEFVAIIGQNGAGKSTLLKNLTGLLTPSAGAVRINGVDTKTVTVSKLSQMLGFVLQNPDRQLFADTVYEEVAFGPQNLKLPPEEVEQRVESALEMTGLTDSRDAFPPALSAGERAKVVIASVAAMRPDIIILDEPTTGQDDHGCKQIMNIARAFHQMGHTIVVVTHNMALVTEYAARTLVFCQGRLLLDGTTQEVFAQADLLKQAYVLPPQVTRLATAARQKLGTDRVFLTVEDLKNHVLSLRSGKIPGSQ